jgi:Cu/Ag efflux pump CusA
VHLISRCQQLEQIQAKTDAPDGLGVVLRAGRERLGSVLTTALATGALFLPFALLGDLPGHEIVNPLAGVLLGGLVTSTFVSLFLTPALYLRFGYGRSGGEALDLRDLWEELDLSAPLEPALVRSAPAEG